VGSVRVGILEGTGGSRRGADKAAAAVATQAAVNGWEPAAVTLAELAERLPELDRVVLCGGDGLVHRAVQVLAGTPAEVAVVPVGSGNDFARAAGLDRTGAVPVAAAPPGGPIAATDLIVADGTYATTVLTGGYSGRVNATANAMRFPPGSSKYTVAALREIARLRPRDVRLTLERADGTTDVIEAPMTLFAIGNTAYFGGGMQICPAANPADGELEVITVGALPRRSFVAWLPKVFRGAHLDHPAVSVDRAVAVTVDTGESLWADGEPLAPGHSTVTARVAAGALRLLVPGG